jgi:hypothetical protein
MGSLNMRMQAADVQAHGKAVPKPTLLQRLGIRRKPRA